MSTPDFPPVLQMALNAQRVSGLIDTAEKMGILDTTSDVAKRADIDEILGFLAALEKASVFIMLLTYKWNKAKSR